MGDEIANLADRVPLPPPAPFGDLPGDLVETLSRSFVDRLDALPLAGDNLMFAFRAGEPTPPTLWHGLLDLGPTAVNLLVRLFERMERVDPTLRVWRQIKYIRNEWWTGSAGMKVVYHDPAAMRACLDGLFDPAARPTVARDRLVGAVEHQDHASLLLALEGIARYCAVDQEPPDCDTWREVDRLGGEALHFCVGKGDLRAGDGRLRDGGGPERVSSHDDIHIDWASPVDGIRSGYNQCTYDLTMSVSHWVQARFGLGKPRYNFAFVGEGIAELGARAGTTAWAADFEDFAARWRAAQWPLAVRGRAGHDGAGAYADELVAIRRRMG